MKSIVADYPRDLKEVTLQSMLIPSKGTDNDKATAVARAMASVSTPVEKTVSVAQAMAMDNATPGTSLVAQTLAALTAKKAMATTTTTTTTPPPADSIVFAAQAMTEMSTNKTKVAESATDKTKTTTTTMSPPPSVATKPLPVLTASSHRLGLMELFEHCQRCTNAKCGDRSHAAFGDYMDHMDKCKIDNCTECDFVCRCLDHHVHRCHDQTGDCKVPGCRDLKKKYFAICFEMHRLSKVSSSKSIASLSRELHLEMTSRLPSFHSRGAIIRNTSDTKRARFIQHTT